MKNILTAVAGFMIGVSFNVNAQSQPSAPPDKHKAGQETLAKRYSRYACAVVHLSNELGSGTGFFVDDKGTVATAAHVIYQNEYGGTQQAPRITLHHPATGVQVITSDNQTFSYTYPAELEQADYTRATADLALMKTGHSSKCYLPLSKRTTESVGEHIIAIGFPGFADNQVLYEGFLSSTGKALPFPVGQIGGQPVYPQYRLLRVQMPITPGASGGPLIDDEGKVLGVISQEPVVWASDLEGLVRAFGSNGQGSGIYLSGFDVTKLLGELAFVVHEFDTAGSGLAIPSSYFEPPPAPNRTH